MAVGPIKQSAAALTFEIEDHVRKGVALEKILVNFKAAGVNFARWAINLDGVVPRLVDRGEIKGPEDTIVPSLDLACGLQNSGENGFASCYVDHFELKWSLLGGGDKDGFLRCLQLIADLID